MLRRMSVAVVVASIAIWAIPVCAAADKGGTPRPPDKQILAQDEVTQLLLLMDANKDGNISKQEWMKFMEAEFDRLDKNKNGVLNVKELAASRVRATRSSDAGK